VAAVRLGLDLLGGPAPGSFANLAAWAVAAEIGGFDSVWVADDARATGPFEATTLLGALAMRTSTLRLGTLVPPGAGRRPGVAAKVLSSVDVVSSGRLLAGVGAGPGGPGGPGGRAVAERLSEAVTVVRALFGGEPVTVAGRTWHLDGAVNRPAPLHGSATPIVVEADGELTPGVARLADVVVVRGSPERVTEVVELAGRGRPVGGQGAWGTAVVWWGRAGRGRYEDDVRTPGTWLDLDRPDACAGTLRELGASGAAGVIVAVDEPVGIRGGPPGDGPERLGRYADTVEAAGRLLAPLVAAELCHAS
jgi:hypothetical protein